MKPFDFNLLSFDLAQNPVVEIDLSELFPQEIKKFVRDYPHFCRRFIGVFRNYIIIDLSASEGREDLKGLNYAYKELKENNLSTLAIISFKDNASLSSMIGLQYYVISQDISDKVYFDEEGAYFKSIPYSIVPKEVSNHERERALRNLILTENSWGLDEEIVYIYSQDKRPDASYPLIKTKYWNELSDSEKERIALLIDKDKYRRIQKGIQIVDDWLYERSGDYNRLFVCGRIAARVRYRDILGSCKSYEEPNSGIIAALYFGNRINFKYIPKIYAICGAYVFMEYIDNMATLEDLQIRKNYKKVMDSFKEWYLEFAKDYEDWRVSPVDEHSNNFGYSKEKGWVAFDFDGWSFSSNKKRETPEERYNSAKFNEGTDDDR